MTKQQYQLWILEHQSDDYILERKKERMKILYSLIHPMQ